MFQYPLFPADTTVVSLPSKCLVGEVCCPPERSMADTNSNPHINLSKETILPPKSMYRTLTLRKIFLWVSWNAFSSKYQTTLRINKRQLLSQVIQSPSREQVWRSEKLSNITSELAFPPRALSPSGYCPPSQLQTIS